MFHKNNYFGQIEIFIFMISFCAAILVYISRLGFENYLFLILKSLSLICFIVFSPSIIIKNKEQIYLKPLISFFILFIIIIFGLIKIITGINISYIFFFLGLFFFVFFIRFLFIKRKNINLKNIFFLIITAFFSIFILSAYYSNYYTHPLMIEKIINGAWAHRDILYHSSVAGMIKTYLYLGTGVDGFVPHYYHFISHFIAAIFSEILNTNTLFFYSIIWPIVITPLFFLFFIYSILEVSSYFAKINNFKMINEKNNFLYILIFIFFSLPFSRIYLPEEYHYIISQSYTIGLILLFFIINILFIFLNNKKKFDEKKSTFKFIFFFIIFLSIAASFSKVSFFYILTIFAIYFFVRLKLYKKFNYCIFIFTWFSFLFFFYFFFLEYFSGRDLFNKGKAMTHEFTIMDQFFFSYVSLFFIIIKLYSLKILSIKKFYSAIKTYKILDIEFIFILIIALYFISFQYFKGIQIYISYIFLIANFNLFNNLINFKK